MKFRMFTDVENGRKIAVNVDEVRHIEEVNKGTAIWMGRNGNDVVVVHVSEDFDTVFSRLNTIAE